MQSAAELYARQVHEQLDLYATWLPGDSIEVGDVGTLRNFLFTPVGHLRDFGIEAATSIDKNAKPRYEFTHNCAASEGVAGAGSGNAVPGVTVSAAIEINFSAEHAVFFRLETALVPASRILIASGSRFFRQ